MIFGVFFTALPVRAIVAAGGQMIAAGGDMIAAVSAIAHRPEGNRDGISAGCVAKATVRVTDLLFPFGGSFIGAFSTVLFNIECFWGT